MDETKPFLCGKKHILGMIHWNGNGVPQLMIYRRAVDLDADEPAEVDVIGPVQGSMPVRCDICGDVKPWSVSVAVMVELFKQLKDEQVLEFSKRILEKSGG